MIDKQKHISLTETFKQMEVAQQHSTFNMTNQQLAGLCLTYSRLEELGLTEGWFKSDRPKAKTELRRKAAKEGIFVIDSSYYFYFQKLKPMFLAWLLDNQLQQKEGKQQSKIKI